MKDKKTGITITKTSGAMEQEVLEKALELSKEGKTEGILFGETSVFIDKKPENAIAAYEGKGELVGKKIYLGKN